MFVLSQIETLVEKYQGLSCCFRTSLNMCTFTEVSERNGSVIKPRIMSTLECIALNDLDGDSSLKKMSVAQGYSEETILPFLFATHIRASLKFNTRNKFLALIYGFPDVYLSEELKEVIDCRDNCVGLMNLITYVHLVSNYYS